MYNNIYTYLFIYFLSLYSNIITTRLINVFTIEIGSCEMIHIYSMVLYRHFRFKRDRRGCDINTFVGGTG
jgi:hypothetical protein